jgi:membrane glycosyltransferase
VSGIVLGLATIATASGWEAEGWLEPLLALAAVVFATAVGVIAVTFAVTALLKAAGVFVVPEQPPGLDRISAIMEQWQAERDATSAKPREPWPPGRAPLGMRNRVGEARRTNDDRGRAAA